MPVYYNHVWYGVVAMDFTFATLRRLLVEAVGDNPEGNTNCMAVGLLSLQRLNQLLRTLIILTRAN